MNMNHNLLWGRLRLLQSLCHTHDYHNIYATGPPKYPKNTLRLFASYRGIPKLFKCAPEIQQLFVRTLGLKLELTSIHRHFLGLVYRSMVTYPSDTHRWLATSSRFTIESWWIDTKIQLYSQVLRHPVDGASPLTAGRYLLSVWPQLVAITYRQLCPGLRSQILPGMKKYNHDIIMIEGFSDPDEITMLY